MHKIAAAFLVVGIATAGIVPVKAALAPDTHQTAPGASRIVPEIVWYTATTSPEPAPRRALNVADGQSCPGWMDVAREVGWPEAQLPMVGAITYFESRCRSDVRGDNGVSWTAFQLHTKSWCRPTRWHPKGYLQGRNILTRCADLNDPHTAARAALAIWQVGGWEQWTTRHLASTSLKP